MPNLLRVISSKKNKNKWILEEPRLYWLDDDDIPASPLEHVIPREHKLSVFEVGDDQARIARVAAAVAAGRQELDIVEYFVFDEAVLHEVEIEIDQNSPGMTCDPIVNFWHRDLIHISANKLVALAKRILPVAKSDFVLKKRVYEVFLESARSTKIDWSLVNLKDKKTLQQQARENQT